MGIKMKYTHTDLHKPQGLQNKITRLQIIPTFNKIKMWERFVMHLQIFPYYSIVIHLQDYKSLPDRKSVV